MPKPYRYSTEAKASAAAARFSVVFPKRQFAACQHPTEFGYAVALYNDGVFLAYCARFKAPAKPVTQRITCYDVGRGTIEIANTGGVTVMATRIERSTRKARTDYWFRFQGQAYWGFLGHDGNAFSAKPVKQIPR